LPLDGQHLMVLLPAVLSQAEPTEERGALELSSGWGSPLGIVVAGYRAVLSMVVVERAL
jgi:hypothetical protein